MRSCWFTSMCNTVYDSSQCNSHLLQRQSVSSEKTGWKHNPAPRKVPLPEPCIRCQDSSVQLELSSPLKASTWQEPVVSACQSPPVKCPLAHPHCPSFTWLLSSTLVLRQVRAHHRQLGEEARQEARQEAIHTLLGPGLTAKEIRSWSVFQFWHSKSTILYQHRSLWRQRKGRSHWSWWEKAHNSNGGLGPFLQHLGQVKTKTHQQLAWQKSWHHLCHLPALAVLPDKCKQLRKGEWSPTQSYHLQKPTF